MLNRYITNGDSEKAYDELVSGNWSKTFFMGKNKKQISAFKEHVSVQFTSIPCVPMDFPSAC